MNKGFLHPGNVTDQAGSYTVLHCFCEINMELLLFPVSYTELLGQLSFCKGSAALFAVGM